MNRYEQYQICKVRGHRPGMTQLQMIPPVDRCDFCGTAYYYEQKLVELDPPKPDNNEVRRWEDEGGA